MSRSLTGGRPAREKEINEIRKSTDCTTGKMILPALDASTNRYRLLPSTAFSS